MDPVAAKTQQEMTNRSRKLAAGPDDDANVGRMKRHLVWFESLDVSGSSETDSWAIRGSEQKFTTAEPARAKEATKREVAVAPIAQASTQSRRTRSRRPR